MPPVRKVPVRLAWQIRDTCYRHADYDHQRGDQNVDILDDWIRYSFPVSVEFFNYRLAIDKIGVFVGL